MSYEKVKQAKKIMAGTKGTVKALKSDTVREVLIAKDADPNVTMKVIEVAREKQVPISYVDSMKQLGKVCGIDVGAAAVAILN